MAKLVENYKQFVGDGSKDCNGLTLEEFLTGYDPYKYKTPSVTADIIVVKEVTPVDETVNNTGLKLLMIKRKNHPCIGQWALPGGFAELDESLVESAKRELEEETGVSGIAMKELSTWGDPDRDPRGRIITVSYLAYLEQDVNVTAGDDAKEAVWVDVKWDLVRTKRSEKEVVKEYELKLTNKSEGIALTGSAMVSELKGSVLKERKITLKQTNGIAFDHVKLIIDALLSLY